MRQFSARFFALPRISPVAPLAAVAALPMLAACGDSVPEDSTAVTPIAGRPAAPASSAAASPPTTRPDATGPSGDAEFLEYIAPLPASWTTYPPENQMRAANWVVPAASGGSQAHVVVFQGIGGGTDANIRRWQGQVMGPDGGPAEPVVSEVEVPGLDLTLVELRGGYRGMGAPDFAPDHIFLGALWDGPSGPVQVRLVGSSATVETARPDFMRFLEGLRLASAVDTVEFPDDWYYTDRATGRRFANTGLLEGHAAPELTLTDWIGDPVTLAELEGRIVVVDFWATWCGPCMKALPHNVALTNELGAHGVTVLGVHDSKRGFERMAAVAEGQGINYPVAVDVASTSEKAWNVRFWPTYAVLDHKGIVRAAGLRPDRVKDVVEALIRARDEG